MMFEKRKKIEVSLQLIPQNNLYAMFAFRKE